MEENYEKLRKHPRIPVKISIISMCKVNDEIMHLGQFGSSVDMSLGGVLFEAEKVYPPGSRVKLSLQIDGKFYDVHGEMIRAEKQENGKVSIAIQFTEISKEGEKALSLFLQKQQNK